MPTPERMMESSQVVLSNVYKMPTKLYPFIRSGYSYEYESLAQCTWSYDNALLTSPLKVPIQIVVFEGVERHVQDFQKVSLFCR